MDDRHLANLYRKALVKLDKHLDSENLEIQEKAIDKVLRFFQPKGDVKGKPLIAQFFQVCNRKIRTWAKGLTKLSFRSG